MASEEVMFNQGEKLLCFYGPLIHEAECLYSTKKDKHTVYLIHYAGWKDAFDRWVPESELLKYNETNLQRQKELQKVYAVHRSTTKKFKRVHTPSPAKAVVTDNEDTSEPKQIKRSRLVTHTQQVKIKTPYVLLEWLVEDWGLMMVQQKLVILPAKISVSQFMADYLSYTRSTTPDPDKLSTLIETIELIKGIFNLTLRRRLLYDLEQPQYDDVASEYPGTPMHIVYGGIHLLRLLYRIGPMLARLDLDEISLQIVVSNIEDILKFMETYRATWFDRGHYRNATPEYLAKIPTEE